MVSSFRDLQLEGSSRTGNHHCLFAVFTAIKRRRSPANIDEGIPLSLSEADYRAAKTGWRGAPMSKTSYTRYAALNETRSARTRGNISQRYGSRGRLELLPEEAGGARTKSPKGCKKRKRSERTFCA